MSLDHTNSMIAACKFVEPEPAFIVGTQIRESVEQLLESASRVDLAVAYWGSAALPMLTAASWKKPTRIICDLMSGFCNVPTIRAMQSNGINIKRSFRIHAKVYWTPTAAIVGSENASANGLNGQAESNKEAALATAQQAVLFSISDWFEQQWRVANVITETDLSAAAERWRTVQARELPPLPNHSNREQQYLNETLTPSARETVMNWAEPGQMWLQSGLA